MISNDKLTVAVIDSLTCPACGAKLARGSSDDFCPACLLRAAMADDSPNQPGLPVPAAEENHGFPSIAERLGARIGRYKLLEQIGEGGFGVVWMAEQEKPLRRRVALKIIKPGMDSREVIARFEAERQALAIMDHPNIASVFDGGETETGRPYFVMELVKGVPITTYCDANQLSTRERLELFIEVCHAVQHAHQKGVIHRDLKPSNILVTVKDGCPIPKVIDFGVAKATLAQLTERTLFTRCNQWIGTPDYMSPEQVGAGNLDVDTRSDIYSLGVLLYELLTGRPPFDPEKLRDAAYDAILRVIREEEPPKPSTRLNRLTEDELKVVARTHRAEPNRLSRMMRGDLDWIVMKALEKDRRRRYETANGLADDLRRHLNNEVVLARPPSAGYRMRSFVARNQLVAGFSCLLALTLLAGAAVSLWQAVRARQFAEDSIRERNLANRARMVAEEAGASRKQQLHEAARADRLLAMELFGLNRDANAFAHLARACEYDPESTLAAETAIFRLNFISLGRLVSILGLHTDEPRLPIPLDEVVRRAAGRNSSMIEAAFTPDGKGVVTRQLNGMGETLQLWEARTGLLLREIPSNPSAKKIPDVPPKLAGVVIDGLNVSFSDPWDDTIGALEESLGHGALLKEGVIPSPDGVAHLALSQTGTFLHEATSATESHLLAGRNADSFFYAGFAPDGLRVVTATEDNRVVMHDSRGNPVAEFPGHASSLERIRFNADGSLMVTASDDVTARVWETSDRSLLHRFQGSGKDFLHSIVFDSGNRYLLAKAPRSGIHAWDLLTGRHLRLDPGIPVTNGKPGRGVCRSDWMVLAKSRDRKDEISVWDVLNHRELARLQERGLVLDDMLVSPDGQRVATMEAGGAVRFWNTTDGRQVSRSALSAKNTSLSQYSADSRRLAVFAFRPDKGEIAAIIDVESGRTLCEFPTHGEADKYTASLSWCGNLFAVGFPESVTRVWDCRTGGLLATLPACVGSSVSTIDFSPDEKLLATHYYHDSRVQIWNVADWTMTRELGGPRTSLMDDRLVFSPNGRLLSGGADAAKRLLIWDVRSGETVVNFQLPDAFIYCQSFSQDGTRLAAQWERNTSSSRSYGPMLLEVPNLTSPVPSWFPDFLRFLAQCKIDSNGHRRVLTPTEWRTLRDRITDDATNDQTRYGELARWFLTPAEQRPVRPGATITRRELADNLVTTDADPVQLERALAYDPGNPLAHLAMARFASSQTSAEYLRRWAHDRLPPRPTLELQHRIHAIEALPAIPRESANE